MTNQLANGHLFNLAIFVTGLVTGNVFAVAFAFAAWGIAYVAEDPNFDTRYRLHMQLAVSALSGAGMMSALAGMF
jgi:hypothetical protein